MEKDYNKIYKSITNDNGSELFKLLEIIKGTKTEILFLSHLLF